MVEDLSNLQPNQIGKEKDAKQLFGGSAFVFENPFEFPRQQENGQSQEPEIGQFKASQRLLNPKQTDQANHQRPLLEHNGKLRVSFLMS
uniref:Uncharacterized protein n=1 Tax=Panagrolaimus davidi TaxID=227884 RepID=A0A914P5K4_9BILA